jgi:hypothetical protein
MGRVKESVMECNYELMCALQEMLNMAEEAYANTSGIDVAAFNKHFAKAAEAGSYWNKGLFSLELKK